MQDLEITCACPLCENTYSFVDPDYDIEFGPFY